MDPKTLAFGAAVVAASIGGAVLVTNKPTKELITVAGGTVTDEAVTEIAKMKPEVSERTCELQRYGTPAGIKLAWFCDGGMATPKAQTELSKMAGADGVSVRLAPRLDGEKVVYDATVTPGARRNLDPVPLEPVAAPKGEVEP